MIVKVKSHKRQSFSALLNYLVHNKDRLFDASGKSMLVTHNLKGSTINKWVPQYIKNEQFRLRKRKDSVYCTHEILSWHRDDSDSITPAKLEKITREYIKLRNPNGLFVAVPHFDRDHFHLHICASGIEYRSGKSMRISKQAFAKLKVDIQNYQIEKFPEFSKSQVNHGRGKEGMKTDSPKINPREKDKVKIKTILKTCFKKANSIESFLSLLEESKVKNYSRAGKLTGIVFGGRKYRFNKLGFKTEHLELLNQVNLRKTGLQRVREKNNHRSLDR